MITALEFYSGIGGMRCALASVDPGAVVMRAMEINPAANQVYTHNFLEHPAQINLEHISAKELDLHAAQLWMLAPPCQPFTRQGNQKGAEDPRSRSFLHIFRQLQNMQNPPKWLILENVVGFEASDMHKLLQQSLTGAGYHQQEFILTPKQYGVPYSRPRYYCLASKDQFSVNLPAEVQPCLCTPALLLQLKAGHADDTITAAAAQSPMASHVTYIPTLNEFLQLQQGWQQPHHHQSLQQQSGRQQELDHLERPKQRQVDTQQDQQQEQQQWQQQQGEQQQLPLESSHLTGLQACLHKGLAAHNSLVQIHQEVPDEVLEKHAEVLDVVSTSSRSCNCFTKGYGKLMRGAGSLLATVDPAQVDPRWLLAAGGSGSLVYQGYGTDGGMDSPVCTNQAHVPATCSCHPLKVTDQQTLSEAWKQLRPRFFTPEEIAMLHSFPETFTFPSSMSSRQCYKLLGNSLSVAVVADLLRYLLGPAICCQT